MEDPATLIVETIDRHLTAPAQLRLMGGAALVLGYGLERATEDADLLMEDSEIEALIECCDLGAVLEATNRDLEPEGLYVSHIWGPEQQILTPEWRESCRTVVPSVALKHLRLETLGPVDLIVSKLCRADEQDLADVGFLVEEESLSADEIEAAMRRAKVPPEFQGVYPAHCDRVRALLSEAPG